MVYRCGWIGLGVMGFPMAGYLSSSGYEMCVYNRSVEKSDRWVREYGGRRVLSCLEVGSDSDFVFSCVGNDDDLREIALGEGGVFSVMRAGSIFIDHTTASADIARELYEEARSRGIGFIDAPISGGQAGAEGGSLTVMCGGDSDIYDRAAPLIGCYSKMCRLLGGAGSGQLTKMVNQICIAGLVEGLAEGLHFCRKSGLDGRAVIDVISKGAAQSWQMENRYETMLDDAFDFGFAVDLMRKDLGICLSEASRCGAHLPVTALVDQFYSEVQSMGGGRWDTSSLLRRLEKKG